MALQLGHRISVDLDFFTQKNFDENKLALELLDISEFTKEAVSTGTVLGKVGDTKFSIFFYKYPILRDKIKFEGIQLLDKPDLAAMKIHALEDRGTKRDFIDVYFLAKEFSIEQMLGFYDQKYSTLDTHLYPIIRSLGYFADAESDENLPKMLVEISWEEIKTFFHKESLRLAKEKLGL